MHLRNHSKSWLALALLAAVALATPAAAEAKSAAKGGPKITVMSRNVFLGADLGPAINAVGIP